MTKKNQQSPSVNEGALAQALETLRHTDECHKTYEGFRKAKKALDDVKAKHACSRCATGNASAKHSPECREAYTTFNAIRKMLNTVQSSCKKCQTRAKVQGVLGHAQ